MYGEYTNTLSVEKAKQALDTDKNIRLIDVRTTQEYKRGHIANSINIPLDTIEDITGIVKDKNAKIFLYCLSGARSGRACNKLEKMGYTDVTNIGGISTWTYGLVK